MIDKHQLYGRFDAACDRRERLADLATRKALDLPVDDRVNITNTRNGLDWLGALMIAAAAMFGGAGLAVGLPAILRPAATPPPPAAAAPTEAPPTRDFRVDFWTDDGTPIDVQREDSR